MKITGLIGSPVSNSWSQTLFNSLYAQSKMKCFYAAIDLNLTSIDNFIEFASSSMAGFNVTSPYKEIILRYISQRDPLVWRLGSANAISNESGTLMAHNTDYAGFKRTVELNAVDFHEKKVCIAGTGGVFRTILYSLISDFDTHSITVLSRDPAKAKSKFQGFEYMEGTEIVGYSTENQYDIIINCTPLGMNENDASPVKDTNFSKDAVAIDLIYANTDTSFLRIAAKAKALCINGREMFFQQAYESYNLFHGSYPNIEIFNMVRRNLEGSGKK